MILLEKKPNAFDGTNNREADEMRCAVDSAHIQAAQSVFWSDLVTSTTDADSPKIKGANVKQAVPQLDS